MMHVLSRSESLKQLMTVYGMPHAHAVRALAIAEQHGVTAQSTPSNKPVTIRAKRNGKEQYEVDDGIPPEAVGRKAGVRYTRGTEQGVTTTRTKERAMPKGRQAAEPVAEDNGAKDLSVYADKEPTAKMVDYHEFLEEQLGQKIDLHSMYVGVTLYPHFQRSDFNKQRTEERRAARAAEAASEPEPAAEAEKPKRGRPAKAAAGGTTGPRAGSATGRGRGRSRATASAPF